MAYNKKIKLLIADDNDTFRTTIKALLEDEDDIEIVGEAVNGKQAVELYREKNPDVVLMDVRMPKMSGIEATSIINVDSPGVKIIGLTSYGGDRSKKEMLKAGATSFIFKDKMSIEKLIEEIKTA